MAFQLSLGRDLSFVKFRSHRIMLAIALASAFLLFAKSFVEGLELYSSFQIGSNAFLASLLAWVISRELDPDRNLVAYIAQIIILFVSLYVSSVPLIFSALVIFSCRFLTKIVGLPIRDWEMIFALAASIAIMFILQNPSIAVFLILVFLIDKQYENAYRYSAIFAIFSLIALVVYSAIHWPLLYSLPSPNVILLLGLLAVTSWVRMASWKKMNSKSDIGDLPLEIARFKWSTLLALFLPFSTLWMGNEVLMAYAPLLASLAAFSIPEFLLKPSHE